ncbi:MAG: hypothetical protein V3T58_00975 [Candidatus Hydrothermarchaeales archaeon]
MRSKIFAIVAAVMLITASFAVVAAQETPKELKGKRLLHRYHVAYHHAEQLRIGMEAVIDYMGDANAGKLEIIKGDFVAKEDELKTVAENNDFKGFKQVMADMRGLVKDFKTESHALLENKVGEAQTMVAKALQENREYLNSLVDNINSAREGVELEAVDEATETSEEKADKASAKGVDVSKIQAKLQEIKEKRETLKSKIEAAIESCSGTGIGKCDTPEAQEYKALRKEIKEDFKELREIARETGMKHRVANLLKASRRAFEAVQKRIAAAEEQGADVAVVKAKLDEVKSMIDSAEVKYEAGDYRGAIEDLKASKVAFVSAAREVKSLRQTRKTEKAGATEETPRETGKPENKSKGKGR